MSHFDKDAVLQAMTGRYADFYSQFTELKPLGGELRGPCPLHGGTGANFAVNPDTGLWNCFSGCKDGGDAFRFMEKMEGVPFPDALAKVGAFVGADAPAVGASEKPKRSAAAPKPSPKALGRIAAEYEYVSAGGELLFQALRYDPKDFRQRRPDGHGGWIWSLGDAQRVLYHLPDVLAAVQAGKPVYLCEGEKDADALARQGFAATTAPMGAKSKPEEWLENYTNALCGANVVILEDNDDAGRLHAQIVAAALYGTAKRVRVVSLPGLPDKGDASDWLAAGGTPEALVKIVKETPDWLPQAPAEAASAEAIVPPGQEWPVPDPAMFYGLAGDAVRLLDPHTEADKAAILVSLLTGTGIAIGRGPYFQIEATRHHLNLFTVLVGPSSTGRKGTAWDQAKMLLDVADPAWAKSRILGGLSSGEGLIHAVRDPLIKQEAIRDKNRAITGYQEVTVDEGEADKRLLVIETEFAKTLRVSERESNTLSATIRQAWDSGDLRVMTKEAKTATDAHIGILGHVTPDELKRELSDTAAANGLANRFLWVCVRRSKLLPDGGNLSAEERTMLATRLAGAVEFGRTVSQMHRTEEATALWHKSYPSLTRETPGLLGAITARAAPLVVRLSMLYALLDEETYISQRHLEAALALWKYAEASARYVFGNSLGDPVADELLRVLKGSPDGLNRSQIGDAFGRNQSSGRLGQAITLLHGLGRIRGEKRTTAGRAAEWWFAV